MKKEETNVVRTCSTEDGRNVASGSATRCRIPAPARAQAFRDLLSADYSTSCRRQVVHCRPLFACKVPRPRWNPTGMVPLNDCLWAPAECPDASHTQGMTSR